MLVSVAVARMVPLDHLMATTSLQTATTPNTLRCIVSSSIIEMLYEGVLHETDKVQVINMRHVNGAFHERVMFFFEGKAFREALTAAEYDGLSPAHLATAQLLYIHTQETRMCIVCGAQPSVMCNCVAPLQSIHTT